MRHRLLVNVARRLLMPLRGYQRRPIESLPLRLSLRLNVGQLISLLQIARFSFTASNVRGGAMQRLRSREAENCRVSWKKAPFLPRTCDICKRRSWNRAVAK